MSSVGGNVENSGLCGTSVEGQLRFIVKTRAVAVGIIKVGRNPNGQWVTRYLGSGSRRIESKASDTDGGAGV